MEKVDPMMRPVPGYSLTQPRGKWNWDKPPRSVDVDKTVSKIIDNLEKPHIEEQVTRLMVAGISIEEILDTIGQMGFAEGEFNPDVAELMKPAVGLYLLGVADKYNVPVKAYADQKKRDAQRRGLDDETILEIMRERNPALHRFIETKQAEQRDMAMMDVEEELSGSFLAELPASEEMENEQ